MQSLRSYTHEIMRSRAVQLQHPEFHPRDKFRGSLCICRGTQGQMTDATMFTARNFRCSDVRAVECDIAAVSSAVFLQICIQTAPKFLVIAVCLMRGSASRSEHCPEPGLVMIILQATLGIFRWCEHDRPTSLLQGMCWMKGLPTSAMAEGLFSLSVKHSADGQVGSCK